MSRETSKGVEILESSKARKRKQVKIPPLWEEKQVKGWKSWKVVKQEKENKSNIHPYEKRNKQRGGNSGKVVKQEKKISQNSTPMRRETSKGVEILESSKVRKRKQF